MIIEPLDGNSAELAAALLAAGLPADDVSDAGRRFFRFSEDGRTVGFGGYELYGADVLVRSLVMLPQTRGQGQGTVATNLLLEQAVQAGASTAYLLTTDAARFFQRLGFRPVDRQTAPAAILATRQAALLCPSTAALMARPLSGSR
ncbi:MAG: arsenic resistance N-acetyltransferase ArsN2 [Mesorhizobium sp.]